MGKRERGESGVYPWCWVDSASWDWIWVRVWRGESGGAEDGHDEKEGEEMRDFAAAAVGGWFGHGMKDLKVKKSKSHSGLEIRVREREFFIILPAPQTRKSERKPLVAEETRMRTSTGYL